MRQRLHYHWITVATEAHRFLGGAIASLGLESLRFWVETDVGPASFSRTCCDGLVTCAGERRGRTIALAWSDFRVNGASYGEANSRRFTAFLRALDQSGRPTPLIHVVNSAGVRLTEGRRVFSSAFALWPALLDYAERHPMLTCAVGKCLGLAPLLYGLGHYRIAVAGRTQINLTGPEVLALFFRQRSDFAHDAAAERLYDQNDLVHELVPSKGAALGRLAELLDPSGSRPTAAPRTLGPYGDGLLSSILDASPIELVPGWCKAVRLFLGTRRDRPLGLFVNPPGHPANLITTRTLDKYGAGLDLFRALGVPIVSLLDSPGVDPRFEQSAANLFRRMLWVGERIIRYPHGSMGVVAGRCFGGATTLVFPKVFGGATVVALRGSRIGTMHHEIVARLLRSRRLFEEWQRAAGEQGPGCEDLRLEGSLDGVIDPAELPARVDRFLASRAALRPPGALGAAPVTRLVS
jgi:acetyl-CoA carboxylase carboxyltransferase component